MFSQLAYPIALSAGKAPLTRAHANVAIVMAIRSPNNTEKCAIHTSYRSMKVHYKYRQGRSATLKSDPAISDHCEVSASRVQYNGRCRVGKRPISSEEHAFRGHHA
jgi:hypothetical protein